MPEKGGITTPPQPGTAPRLGGFRGIWTFV